MICLNPTSTREPRRGAGRRSTAWRTPRARRRAGGWATRPSACAPAGTEVVLIQPVAEDLAVMGRNLMSGSAPQRGDRDRAAHRGASSCAAARASASSWRTCPPGEPHKIRMPDGPPAQWPELVPAGSRRARRLTPRPARLRRPDGETPARPMASGIERTASRRPRTARRTATAPTAHRTLPRPPLSPRRAPPALIGRALGAVAPPGPGARAQGRPRRARPRLHPRVAARPVAAGQPLVPRRGARPRADPGRGPGAAGGQPLGRQPDARHRRVHAGLQHLLRRRAALLPAGPQPGAVDARAWASCASTARWRPRPHNADKALDSGAALLVYPGGDYEVHRPSWERAKVDFGGRKGFIRLALEQGRADRAGGVGRRPGDGAVPQPRRGPGQAAAPRQDVPAEGAADLAGAAVGPERRRHARPRARARRRSRSRCCSRSTCASATARTPTSTRSTPT